MLGDLLSKLGYSEKESRLYCSLVELGESTAAALSKHSKIPRATVYGVIDQLIDRGVVRTERRGTRTVFVSSPPQAFSREIDEEKERLQQREIIADEIKKVLTPQLRSASIPQLNFLEGKRNIESFLYEMLPEWRKSTKAVGDCTLWGYQDHTFVEEYRRWHNHLWSSMDKSEKIHLFSNPSSIEKELVHKINRREVRRLPAEYDFKSSIWLYGDYIFMAITRQKPHIAVHIRNDIFASNLRAIFKILWLVKS